MVPSEEPEAGSWECRRETRASIVGQERQSLGTCLPLTTAFPPRYSRLIRVDLSNPTSSGPSHSLCSQKRPLYLVGFLREGTRQ